MDLSKELQADLERRESAFVAKLSKAGLPDLAAEYADINTLRHAVEIITARKPRPSRTHRANGTTTPALEDVSQAAPEGFVLSDAVRDAIREIGDKKFRTLHVFSLLQDKYPEYINLDKRGSISATLSNLVTSGEIAKEVDGQRKVWYRAADLRQDQPQVFTPKPYGGGSVDFAEVEGFYEAK
jgi:hypothetical protein